jgi:hypothetical protein
MTENLFGFFALLTFIIFETLALIKGYKNLYSSLKNKTAALFTVVVVGSVSLWLVIHVFIETGILKF